MKDEKKGPGGPMTFVCTAAVGLFGLFLGELNLGEYGAVAGAAIFSVAAAAACIVSAIRNQ